MTTSISLPLVLYADNDQRLSAQLKHIFLRDGFRLEIVEDGVEALACARQRVPALVILDSALPGMNGLDVLRQMRAAESTSNIPTIVISSQPRRAADVDRGLSLGADDWLNKPFSPRELLARARNKMRTRQLQADLWQRTSELEALLHASDQLNRLKSVSELLQLVPQLAFELLPGTLVAMGRVDENGKLRSHLICRKDGKPVSNALETTLTDLLQAETHSRLVVDEAGLPGGWASGMVAVVHHGEFIQASTFIARASGQYHARHLQLLEGIGQQAVLALADARSHELLTEQNLDLEETVRKRSADLLSTQNMLIRSEKLATIGHMAAGLAHEINNPLQPIRILLDDMLEDIQAGVLPEREDIVRIQDSIGRIRNTVGQLLDMASREKDEPEFSRVNLADVLQDVVRLNHKLFEQGGLEIVVTLPPLPAVCGNRDQLGQVFINLLLNARAAMTQGGSVTIAAQQQTNVVEIYVRDTGKGISPKHIKEIFEPYFTTREEGRGLGLFISYSIIQNHSGEIEVESRVGAGSTFTVRLPLATGSCEQSAQPAATQVA